MKRNGRFSHYRLVTGESYGMKKIVVYCAVALTALSFTPSALAIKEFGEHWAKFYVEKSDNDDFKKLVSDAKCNVCHVHEQDKKKVRNPYGTALQKGELVKSKFTKERMKQKPDEVREEIEAIFKKIEDEKAKDQEDTFGKKIKSGKLPGGDIHGK